MSPYWQGSTPARTLGRCRRVLARVGQGGKVPRPAPTVAPVESPTAKPKETR